MAQVGINLYEVSELIKVLIYQPEVNCLGSVCFWCGVGRDGAARGRMIPRISTGHADQLFRKKMPSWAAPLNLICNPNGEKKDRADPTHPAW